MFLGDVIGFILADNQIKKVPKDIKSCFDATVWKAETSMPVIMGKSAEINLRNTSLDEPHQKTRFATADLAVEKNNIEALQLRVNKRCYSQLRNQVNPPTAAMKEKLQKVIKEVSFCDKSTSAQLEAFHSSMQVENGGDGSQDFSQEFIAFGLF